MPSNAVGTIETDLVRVAAQTEQLLNSPANYAGVVGTLGKRNAMAVKWDGSGGEVHTAGSLSRKRIPT
jgi:hypothetical protein